jgi:hypothetical protein
MHAREVLAVTLHNTVNPRNFLVHELVDDYSDFIVSVFSVRQIGSWLIISIQLWIELG